MLNVNNSQGEDLGPVAGLVGLARAAMDRKPITDRWYGGGLSYSYTPVARRAPFDKLVELDADSTVQTINFVRSQQGLPPFTG